MPVAATKHTAAGAKAFAEFFIKTIDWGYATVNSSYMRYYMASGCVQCANIANSMDRTAKAQHRYVGGRLTIRSASGSVSEVKVIFDIQSIEVIDKVGKYVTADTAHKRYGEIVRTEWVQDHWLARELEPKP